MPIKAMKETGEPGRVVVVQQIKTTWTKASRGGDAAARRNAVPEVAQVPVHRAEVAGLKILLHQLLYSGRSGFADPVEKLVENPDHDPLRLGGVTIDTTEELLRAEFTWSRECGAPDRGWMRKTLLLGVNEWGQICYNGRFAEEAGWVYEKIVVNAGLFEPPSGEVFTRTEPTQRYSAMGHLL